MTNSLADKSSPAAAAQVLDVASSIVNSITCLLATDTLCASQHRLPCGKITNTCGTCMPGYLGDEGEGNTVCITAPASAAKILGNGDLTIPVFASAIVACTSTSCTGYMQCVNKVCITPSKSCINNCNGNGTCSFILIDSGAATSTCLVDNPRCQAACTCKAGRRGLSCDTTVAVNIANQKLRFQLISGLQALTVSQDQSLATVTGWVSSVTSLTQNYAELSTAAIAAVIQIVSSIIAGSVKLSLPYAQVSALKCGHNPHAFATNGYCFHPIDTTLFCFLLFSLSRYLSLTPNFFVSPDLSSAVCIRQYHLGLQAQRIRSPTVHCIRIVPLLLRVGTESNERPAI